MKHISEALHRVFQIFPIATILIGNIAAQTPAKFEHIGVNDGLNDLTVNAIVQDSLGILYFGTANGVNIYDGASFEQLTANKPNSISDNSITTLFLDKHNILWIGHAQGVDAYDRRTGKVRNYSLNTGLYSVRTIYEDKSGKIWIGSFGSGLHYFDRERDAVFEHKTRHNLNGGIGCITGDQKGNIWFGTENSGLFVMDPNTNEIFSTKNGIEGISDAFDFKNYRIRSLCPDNQGNMYIGTYSNGVFIYNFLEKKIERFLPENSLLKQNLHITKILIDFNENLWIASDGSGLFHYDTKKKILSEMNSSSNLSGALSSRAIRSIYIDNNKTLWVSTYRGGVNYSYVLQEKKFYHFNDQLANKSVTCVLEVTPEKILLGTDGGGLYSFNSQNGKTKRLKPDIKGLEIILSLHSDNNTIFVGTYSDGIYTLDKDFNIIKQISVESNGINSNDVRAISSDKDNYYFATHGGGLNIYNKNDQQSKFKLATYTSPSLGISHDYLRTQLIDSRGYIWIATMSGLSVYNPKSDQNINIFSPNSSKFNASVINCIYEDSQGYMWFGTKDGLSRLEKSIIGFPEASKYSFFDTANYRFINYLPPNKYDLMVFSIEEDLQGNLWLGTNKSLARFNLHTEEAKIFYPESGIDIQFFNPNASTKLSNDCLLFGGTEGVVCFLPDSISDVNLTPRVIISQLTKNNKPITVSVDSGSRHALKQHINFSKEVVIDPKTRIFSIEFATTNSYLKDEVEYAYKLENFEKEWTYTTQRNRVSTYTNLNPGTYNFMVKARYNNADWNNDIKILKVKIQPPFYKTWGFRISILGLFVLLIYIWHRKGLLSLEKNNAKLEDLVSIKSKHLIEEQKANLVELKKNKELIIQKEKAEKERLRLEKEMHKAQNEKQQAQNEKLRTELELKSKEENLIKGELSASLAQISKKNDTLQKLKNKLSVLLNSDGNELKENLRTLIQKIESETFFQDDWHKFEQHFNVVYTDFIQHLKSKFPELTRKDLRMCSYLRMNLNNKEIAQLSNITIRGVEKSRSRLRKKLDIPADQDLNSFIITLQNEMSNINVSN